MEDNIEIYQGDDYTDTIYYKNADDTPVDLTGYAVKAQIRARPSGVLVAEFVCEISDAANGAIVRSLPHTISATLGTDVTAYDQTAVYWHDLELTAPNGTVTTILKGQVVVTAEVTKV